MNIDISPEVTCSSGKYHGYCTGGAFEDSASHGTKTATHNGRSFRSTQPHSATWLCFTYDQMIGRSDMLVCTISIFTVLPACVHIHVQGCLCQFILSFALS